jgi:hypothetical protein
MRVALLVTAAAVVLPISLPAQAPKSLTITRDLLISPEEADLAAVQHMAVSPHGQIAVPQRKQKLLKVFGPNGGVSTIGRGGGGPGEFQNPTRIGFVGDSLWALDPSLSRVSIFGPDLKYVRGFPQPLSLGLERNDLPIAYSTQAVLPGGDLRAIASFRPTSPRPAWAAGVDSGADIIVRISPSGEYKKRLAVLSPDKCIVEYRYAKGSGTTGIPFCPSPLSTDWDGGTGVASVDVEVSEGKAARYRVTVVDDQGVARFSRSIGYVPVPATKGAADSLAAIRAMIIKDSPPDAVAAMPKPKPYQNFPPIRRVILGRDYSVWLEERILGPGHRWLVLDPKGVTVGVVTVPSEITLRAAELGTAWGTINDADDVQGVVRYRVGR